MENTHVNVSGHKITTNKVGTEHEIHTFLSPNISEASQSGFYPGVYYTIINGICYVAIELLWSTATGDFAICNLPLPKNGRRAIGDLFQSRGSYYLLANGELHIVVITSSANLLGSFCYPVADDWSE